MNFDDMKWTMTMAKCPCCKSHLAYSSDNNYNTWKCYSCGFTMFKQRKEQMMTKEKAIDLLDDLVGMVDDKDDSDYDTALKMGIQALSQEPTVQDKQAESEKYQKAFDDGYANGYEQARFDYEKEPCDDVVSRQAVINAIENDCMKGGLGSCFACYNDAQAFRGEIEKLPSVTQKSGKWIRVTDKTGHLVWECDKCSWQQRFNTNFCPDCGAKMESEDEK